MNKHHNPELLDDNPEWTAENIKNAMPFSNLPKTLQAKLARQRGPNKTQTKERISIRLSPEVVQYFRSSGAGWQARMDSILKDWVTHHR